MESAFCPPRGSSAGAAGAPNLPEIDYDAYRRKAARLRAEAYRQAGLALRDMLVRGGRRVRLGVKGFTYAVHGTWDTEPAPRSGAVKPANPLAVYVPQLLRANDNRVISRQSESA
jgi:hypothetical protein